SDARSTKSAVALAHQILSRSEALVLDQPVEDDARQVLDIRFWVVEALLGFFFGHLCIAESGPHRIDEHQIGEVEPGTDVVDRGRWIGWAVAFGAELHALGT